MIETIRLKLADFLNIEYINNGKLFFNNWSIVHILGGFTVGKFFKFIKPLWALGIIILWEIFEVWASYNTSYFILEPVADIVWDIILTFSAFMIGKAM